MLHIIQICTQDKENKKKRTHTTVQQWPVAYLLHQYIHLLFTRNGSSKKKKYKKRKSKKYTNIRSESTKKPICIV